MTSRWDYDSLFIDGAWTASDVTRRRRQCPWSTAKRRRDAQQGWSQPGRR